MATSNNYYQLYLDNVFKLAETIVIKSAHAAEGINRWVRAWYGSNAVDDLDPATWKYYLNLSGQYHLADSEMKIVSMDTLEEITFSKASLEIHRATKRGYAYGTRQYKELVARYPAQEMLILGILYPVDIQEAIAAADGQILGYPAELVEANEYSLVTNLQEWINAFRLRWTNYQYAVSDDLYPATAMGLLYINLVPAILNLRLAACKTNEAHSFHVRMYLASHGMLDAYLDNMTIRQALFFYRNIAYIERNSGQQNIFTWLVEHIMTERSLPIAEYVMHHDLSAQPVDLYPTVAFRKNPINPAQSNVGEDVVSLERLLNKEDVLARDNPRERVDQQTAIQELMENSAANVLKTKALESSMIDYSNATPYTLEDTLVNHWLWLSSNGYYYQAVVAVTNPKTGERIPMMVKDAFVFFWYAYCASNGVVLDEVPSVFAKRVMRLPVPSTDAVMGVVEASVLPRSVVEQMGQWMPIVQPMISTEAFYDKCVEINQAANWQRFLVADQEHQLRRGYAMNAMEQFWSDNVCQLASANYSYDAWFSDRNIRIADFTQDDLGVAWLSLMKDATGISLHNTNSLRNLQKAMVKMLAQLSSYTVQFLSEINASDIHVGDAPAARLGDTLTKQYSYDRIQGFTVEPVDLKVRQRQRNLYDLTAASEEHVSVRPQQTARLEIAARVHSPEGEAMVLHARMESAPVYFRPVVDTPENSEGMVPVFGLETFIGLTPGQRSQLRDVWRTHWATWPPAGDQPLLDVVSNIHLPGFNPPDLDLTHFIVTNKLDGFDEDDLNPPAP